ncbi:hypothetical protein [Streptomyces sp. ICBB 8177]|uniref:hypothetical protein n=1 Tax=Streptomyces sp. ICBB 8177 TaxID=563922 RepID=UPI0013051D95|nr:hypothetical protein [Streptomyces sp. ICBB 8177]
MVLVVLWFFVAWCWVVLRVVLWWCGARRLRHQAVVLGGPDHRGRRITDSSA